jgi:hypothetical protein
MIYYAKRSNIRHPQASLDHLGRLEEERCGDRQAQRLGSLEVMTSSNVGGRSTRRSAGLAPFKMRSA